MDLSDRAARPATRTRITAIGLVFALALSYLSAHLFILQCFRYEHYKSQVYEQITTSSSLRAARGETNTR